MRRRWPILAGAGTLLLGSLAVGLIVGTGSAPTGKEADRVGEQAYGIAFDASFKNSFSRARQKGLSKGDRQGRKKGASSGKSNGTSGGAADASAELAAIEAERQAEAAKNTICFEDGYCVQRSPGGGGPPCPPDTVENAGGVVCVPLSMIKP